MSLRETIIILIQYIEDHQQSVHCNLAVCSTRQ